MVPLRIRDDITNAEQVSPPKDGLSAAHWGVLNKLRLVAMSCRASAYADLFQACALLSGQRGVAQDAHARALTRCLRQATGKRPIFYHPGEAAMSFDEAWIMRAVVAAQSGDQDSFEFLIRSRIAQPDRRNIAFLLHGIAERFGRN